MNPWYFRDKKNKEDLLECTTQYFQENEGSVEEASTFWEEYKTVIRGHVQAQIGIQKKKHNEYEALEREISELEKGTGEGCDIHPEVTRRLRHKWQELRYPNDTRHMYIFLRHSDGWMIWETKQIKC